MNTPEAIKDAKKPIDPNYYTDYADGIRACLKGKKHEFGSDRYDQGYSDQYTLEQVINNGKV